MPGETTPPPPLTDAQVADQTDARLKAQVEKMQAAFADNLIDAFSVAVIRCAQTEDSALAVLTLAQHEELLACLRHTVTQPPPDVFPVAHDERAKVD